MWLHRAGRVLTLASILLVIIAFFTPWFDVYKLNDPSYLFPKRGYSPWSALLSGRLDTLIMLIIMIAVYALLILLVAQGSLALALRPRLPMRTPGPLVILTLIGLGMTGYALYAVPFDLSFSWPYLDHDTDYGGYLALAGWLIALTGLALAALVGQLPVAARPLPITPSPLPPPPSPH